MLIITGNRTINFEQVFFFSVDVPIPAFLNAKGANAYAIRAHHSGVTDNDGNPDCVVIKSYANEAAAYVDLDRIITAYQNGAKSVDLR